MAGEIVWALLAVDVMKWLAEMGRNAGLSNEQIKDQLEIAKTETGTAIDNWDDAADGDR